MRTTIYIRRNGRHVATEYARDANDAWLVLNKYVHKFSDDQFTCEPLLDGGFLRPFWTVRFTRSIQLNCIDLSWL